MGSEEAGLYYVNYGATLIWTVCFVAVVLAAFKLGWIRLPRRWVPDALRPDEESSMDRLEEARLRNQVLRERIRSLESGQRVGGRE